MAKIYGFILPLLVTGGLASAAASEKLCVVSNPTDVDVSEIAPGFAGVNIQNSAVAQAFYDGMTDVNEQLLTSKEVPKGTVMYRRTGHDFICFKGLLGDCAYYSCNFTFRSLKKGEIRRPGDVRP